jgi:hypothetical protein
MKGKFAAKLGRVGCMDAVTGLAEGRLGWTLVSGGSIDSKWLLEAPMTPTVAHRRSTQGLLVSFRIVRRKQSQKDRLNGKIRQITPTTSDLSHIVRVHA